MSVLPSVLRFVSLAALAATTACVSDSYGYAPEYPAGYDSGMGSGQYIQQGDLFGGQNVADVRVFYEPLAPYGGWVQSQFGYAFRPNVDANWRPYVNGRWGENRLWLSNDPWGWATDHYGRWGFDDRMNAWVWVPGTEWAPSWVAWREDDQQDVAGWAPIPPGVAYSVGVGFASALAYSAYNDWYAPSWVWVPRNRIYTPGFGGGVLPWRYGQNYWGNSHWNHNSGWNGRPGYGRPPGYGNGYPNGGRPPGYSNGGRPPGYSNGGRPPGYQGGERPPNYTGGGRPPGYGNSGRPPGYNGDGHPPSYNGNGRPPGYNGDGRPPGYNGDGHPPGYTGSGRPPGYTGDGRPPSYTGGSRPPGSSWSGQSGQGRPGGESAQHGGNGQPGSNWQGRPPQPGSSGGGNTWGNRPPQQGNNAGYARPPGSNGGGGGMNSPGRPGYPPPSGGAPPASGMGSGRPVHVAPPPPAASPPSPPPRPERAPPQQRRIGETANEKPQ